jgi:protein-tyrosine phosphatase
MLKNAGKSSFSRSFVYMIKILFICHGNICRSPMAEFILKDMVKKRGIAEQFEIASAATSTEEIWNGIGNPVYPPARAELAIHGISCEGKRAVQLTKDDYEKYDLLIGMDSMNIKNMYRMTDGTNLKEGGKIFRLLDFTDEHRDVADPWYTGNFAKTYNDIVKGCKGLLNYCICQ